jgi:hypothetical protein
MKDLLLIIFLTTSMKDRYESMTELFEIVILSKLDHRCKFLSLPNVRFLDGTLSFCRSML